MSLGDLFVWEEWTNLKPNSIETKSLKTDELNCAILNVNTMNYNNITCKNQPIRLNPLYIVNQTVQTFEFKTNYFIDFNVISQLSDVVMTKQYNLIRRVSGNHLSQYLQTNIPHYMYNGDDPITIALELSLYYSWGVNLTTCPRFYINIFKSDNINQPLFRTQFGIFDNLNTMNLLNNTYLIDLLPNQSIFILLEKYEESNNTYTLMQNSFMKITQV